MHRPAPVIRRRSVVARLSLIGVGSVLVVAAAACSSASKSSTTSVASGTSTTTSTTAVAGPGGTVSSDPVIQKVVKAAAAEGAKLGFDLDPGCLSTLVAKLSPADLSALAGAADDTSPTVTAPSLTDAGKKLGETLFTCSIGSANTALINQAADQLLASPGSASLDPDCVRNNFKLLNDSQLNLVINAGADSTDPHLQSILLLLYQCVKANLSSTTSVLVAGG